MNFILLLFYIPFASLYQVSFSFKCDDYCMTLIDGNKKKDIGKGIRYTTREFSGDFSLNNPIGIYIYNEKYAFGIAGKADFYYFKVTTTIMRFGDSLLLSFMLLFFLF